MKKRQRQDVCVASYCSYGVRKGPVQKTLFYLFNQVITLSPTLLDGKSRNKGIHEVRLGVARK